MLKLLFWGLLAANGALLAWHYLGSSTLASDDTVTHVSKPLNADKLIIISAEQATRTTSAAAEAATRPAGAPVAGSPAASAPASGVAAAGPTAAEVPARSTSAKVAACTEIGPFLPDDAKRFEARLAPLALGERQARRNVQEVASHMVYIPPQGSKEGADKKAAELQRLGISDYYVIQDNSPMRWGISLGVFKTEQAAKNHLANLSRQGVRTAQIGPRSVARNKAVFQLRDLDDKALQSLEKIKGDFPGQELRACK